MASKRVWWLLIIVMILIAGCQSEKPGGSLLKATWTISQSGYIEEYLIANIGISAFGGQVFCSYQPLDATQGVQGEIYLWVLCQEFYVENELLMTGTGISLPVVLRVQEKNDCFTIIEHFVPRDGAYYGQDVRDLFPRSTWRQINPQSEAEIIEYNNLGHALEKDTETKATSFYGVELP